jgi:4'-phosphopantetheinyl transferase
MIGYHLTYNGSLCGMAMTQGTQRKVVNIGIGIKHVSVDPLGITVPEYVESQSHKVSTFLLRSSLGHVLAMFGLCCGGWDRMEW